MPVGGSTLLLDGEGGGTVFDFVFGEKWVV